MVQIEIQDGKMEGDKLSFHFSIDFQGTKVKLAFKHVELQATNMKIENNELRFSISGEVRGTKIKADYKGRPYGDKIKGMIDYTLGDNFGEIDFAGTRKTVRKTW